MSTDAVELFVVAKVEAQAAYQHFNDCGPFCEHIELCPACVNEFGVCDAHAERPWASIRFQRPVHGETRHES